MTLKSMHVVMTPTSIASTGAGSSSSINSNGSVSFTSCTTLSLNGVFTSSYDNYMIATRYTGNSGGTEIALRLRDSGVDASTNYTFQYLVADSTTIGAARVSSQTFGRLATIMTGKYAALTTFLYGPKISQPTAYRSVTNDPYTTLRILDIAGTHSTSSSYDGVTLLPGGDHMSGLVTVLAFNQ